MRLNANQDNGVEAIRKHCLTRQVQIKSEVINHDNVGFEFPNGDIIFIPIEDLFENPDTALGMFVRYLDKRFSA